MRTKQVASVAALLGAFGSMGAACNSEWSTPANWTNDVPTNGAHVSLNVTGGGNPSGYDDTPNLFLDSLNVTDGFSAVSTSLSVGYVTFGSSTASVDSDDLNGGAPSSLEIERNVGTGRIAATGPNAVTHYTGAIDPGNIWQVDSGGLAVVSPTPSPASGF